MSLAATHHYAFAGIQEPRSLNDPNPNRKQTTRKRRDRSGTRCVAALNATQLARKRANDREAQRATRQRTKEYIEKLDRRIRELTDGASSERELDEIQQRNHELEKELIYLKGSVALRMRDVTQWEGAKVAWNGLTPSNCSRSVIDMPSPFTSENHISPRAMMEDASYQESMWESAWCPPIYEVPYGGSPASETSTCGTVNTGLSEMIPASLANSLPVTSCTSMDGRSPQEPALSVLFPGYDPESRSCSYVATQGLSTPMLGCHDLVTPAPNNSPIISNVDILGIVIPRPATSSRLQNAWTLPLRLSTSTGPFDAIILDLLQRQRNLSYTTTDAAAVVGPLRPSMRPLLYPEQRNESHPISSVISTVLHKTALRDLPEKAAVLYLTYKLAKWQILPTCESYHALPEWLTPRISQLLTPHPIWVSQIPWGKLRDKVIENLAAYATDEFQYLYLRSLNINWTWRAVDAFVWSPGGEEVTLQEGFEDHVSTLANWSLDEPFAQKYPELRDFCRFTRDVVMAFKAQP